MTKTKVTVLRHERTNRVYFSQLEDGEWFVNAAGALGVKVDGRGFYPGTGIRGTGDGDLLVQPVPAVLIQSTELL